MLKGHDWSWTGRCGGANTRQPLLVALACVAFALVASAHGQEKPKVPGLSLQPDQLCRQLSLDEVNRIMSGGYERRDDSTGIFCEYRHAQVQARFLTLGSSEYPREAWVKLVIGRGKGKVTERTSILVGDYDGKGFGPLDEVWFVDAVGHRLYIRIQGDISEEEAVALARAARN